MSETAAATRKADDSSTPFKGELRSLVTHIADRGYPHTTAITQTVLQIYDGENWVPLEANEGIAVVNEIIRRLMVPKAVDEVPRQQDPAADRSRSEPQPPSARSLPPD